MTTTPAPPHVGDPTANQNSPRGQTLTLTPTPWVQVVRGGESPESSSPPPPLSPEKTGESSDKVFNGNVGNKTAWSKPDNGVMTGDHGTNGVNADGGNGCGDIIGGFASWPALSESTRPGFKLTVVDSVKSTVDGSGPVTSNTREPDRGGSNTNYNIGGHNAGSARPRMARRGGGGGGNRQGSFSRVSTAPRAPSFPVPEVAPSGFGNAGPVAVTPAPDTPSRDSRPNDHPNHHRGSNWRGNNGQQNRRDGRNTYRGGRRDHEWNSSQIQHHPLDPHGHQRLPSQAVGFGTPYLQVAPPFPVPPPFRPYGNAMAYADMPPVIYYPFPPESFRGMPSFPVPPPPPYVAMAEPPLHLSIVKQIDYYFSDANLVKDEYLRKNMDAYGWVNIGLIASFPRVQNLTTNIPLILQCLSRLSLVVEVQGEKVRRRDDWKKWVTTPNELPLNCRAAAETADVSEDTLAQSLHNTSLQEVNHHHTPNEYTVGIQVEKKENQE